MQFLGYLFFVGQLTLITTIPFVPKDVAIKNDFLLF